MRKRTFILGTSILLIICALFIDLSAQVSVKGYYRKDGTYVRPHTRSSPDGNPYNNYSFPGNYNPNSGKISTGNPETYLKNYYNRNNYSSPSYSKSSTSSYYPATVEPPSYSSDTQTSSTVNSLLIDLRKRINKNTDNDIDIQLLNDLIISLQSLKAQVTNRNSISHSTTRTKLNTVSNQSFLKRYQSHNKAYHIIIYSETTRELAESRAKQIQSQYALSSYQREILPAVVNGMQWYRVAVGNFNRYTEAREKLSLLSRSIPGDSWILKY